MRGIGRQRNEKSISMVKLRPSGALNQKKYFAQKFPDFSKTYWHYFPKNGHFSKKNKKVFTF